MLIKAHVTSMHCQPAPAGHRLYAVFETAEQDTLGIWTSISSQDMLHVGDQVLLERNHSGRLRLALKPLPYAVQLKVFSFLNRAFLRSRSIEPAPISSASSHSAPLRRNI